MFKDILVGCLLFIFVCATPLILVGIGSRIAAEPTEGDYIRVLIKHGYSNVIIYDTRYARHCNAGDYFKGFVADKSNHALGGTVCKHTTGEFSIKLD